MFWQSILRPLMFCLPAERAHYTAMNGFRTLARLRGSGLSAQFEVNEPGLASQNFGLHFKNPIGLAAGFDKDARWYNELSLLGFSHIEVGTITGHGQPGNDKPRLFRLPEDQAIINRMGFNNEGSERAAERLSQTITQKPAGFVLGINIGKTKAVPLQDAHKDYLKSFQKLYRFADYFTVNVSSPNTPGLRQLQDREPLLELLSALNENNSQLAETGSPCKPILLKIAPDLNDEQIQDIAAIARDAKLAGLIATNTTIERAGLKTSNAKIESIGAGGLSGKPLTRRSRDVVNLLYRETGGKIPIIGVGGIMSGEDAWQMILAGATLLQIYTGFIYGGPKIVKTMNLYLAEKLRKNNLQSITEAVGGQGKFD